MKTYPEIKHEVMAELGWSGDGYSPIGETAAKRYADQYRIKLLEDICEKWDANEETFSDFISNYKFELP